MITVPTRRADESDLAYLKRKEIAFGLWQADALERIAQLESDLAQSKSDSDKYRLAFMHVHEALGIVGKHAMLQADEISTTMFARDFAPWQNIMAHNGIDPYVKQKRGKRGANAPT